MKGVWSFFVVFVVFSTATNVSPHLQFHLESPMTLVYSNNPEQLWSDDLCDNSSFALRFRSLFSHSLSKKKHTHTHTETGGVSILEERVGNGDFRHFWEYLNQNTCELGWAIVVTNEGISPM